MRWWSIIYPKQVDKELANVSKCIEHSVDYK
jgi:hypothetical protein